MSSNPLPDWQAKVNRLAKWRGLLAGWQLGTRPDTDPECQAVRDHREATLMQRAEITAIVGLLVDKGVFTIEEFTDRCGSEADLLCMALEAKFPGVHATDDGLSIEPQRAVEWMKGWRP